eukprot:755646-Hanusia_phi.AAC.9
MSLSMLDMYVRAAAAVGETRNAACTCGGGCATEKAQGGGNRKHREAEDCVGQRALRGWKEGEEVEGGRIANEARRQAGGGRGSADQHEDEHEDAA